MTQEALKELLEAVEEAIQAGDWKVDGACDPDLAIRRAKQALAQTQEPVALEAVYETIIQWDEGGGKRSRRELARRIVSLYTTPPQRKPLLPQSPCEMTQAESKMFKLGWLECEAAHGITGEKK